MRTKLGSQAIVSASLDVKLLQKRTGRHWPKLKQIWHIKKMMPKTEKLIFSISLFFFLLGLVWFGWLTILKHRQMIPAVGGIYTEAEVGTPGLINPLFASSNDVDMDITELIYSGLVRYDEKQKLVPDLAVHYTVSDDKKSYTFELRRDVVWQDGEKFTGKDVIFTFDSIQNLAVNSPLNITFKGIKVSLVDEYTVRFDLSQPFGSFLSSLTVGILPEHTWSNVSPEQMRFAGFNLKPVGTGPFMFKRLVKDGTGQVYQYELSRFNKFYRQPSYLQGFVFQFYPSYEGNEGAIEALRQTKVDGLSFVPFNLKDRVERKHIDLHILQLPQYTALFLNQDHQPILKDKDLRTALAYAVDKNRILHEVLKDEGQVIYGPILPDMPGFNAGVSSSVYSYTLANKLLDVKWPRVSAEAYRELLRQDLVKQTLQTTTSTDKQNNKNITLDNLTDEQKKAIESVLDKELNPSQTFYRQDKNGNVLELNIVTVDNDQYKQTAQLVAGFWQEVGVKTILTFVGQREMADVFKNRNYDILLYGEIVGSDPDPYPFWHSSQINYPGLNLARFVDRNVDSLLEKARATTDPDQVAKLYSDFQNIIIASNPAIFLYMPTYTYATSDVIKGMKVNKISEPADRFADVVDWYMNTKWQWK